MRYQVSFRLNRCVMQHLFGSPYVLAKNSIFSNWIQFALENAFKILTLIFDGTHFLSDVFDLLTCGFTPLCFLLKWKVYSLRERAKTNLLHLEQCMYL